ncbi:UDP-2,3-diacylglucosamine diphosphatase LpxI [Xanthobacter sp. KR7-225]|uniref:LpxI family protein n=1 Tax=Xanthobacter sp. KR7-225 TaxID=3156613 RepID=UPI0032B42493
MSEPPPPGTQAPAAGPGAGRPPPRAEAARAGRGPLGIVAGSGAFPGAVAEAVAAEGREVVLFLIQGFADPALERYEHVWFRLGSLGKVAARGRARGIRDLVMVGGLTRPRMRDLGFDLTMLRLLPRIARLFRGGDNHLLSGVLELVQEQGFHLIGAHEAAPSLLLPEGVLGSCRPTADQEGDMAKGLAVIRTLGPFDVGQAVIVADGWVVAVEAAEGTDQMLARFGALRRSGRLRFPERHGVLVKAPKPGQDRRVDLPSLGPHTVRRAAEVGLAGIAFEARGAIVPDVETLVQAADGAGLFVVGMSPPSAGRLAGSGGDGEI